MKILAVISFFIIFFLLSPLALVIYKGLDSAALARLLAREDILSSAAQSLELATLSAVIATLLGTCTAFALPRLPVLARNVVKSGLVFPMILPEIAMGLAFLVWFVKLGWPLGFSTLLSSHVAFSLSYSTLVMKAQVEALDRSLFEAARDLGASKRFVFRHALIPQLTPGLMASFVTCFTLSLDDFIISFFVKGLDQMLLPIQIYSMMRIRIGPEIYSLSLILFCISVSVVLLTQVWLYSRGKQSSAVLMGA